MNELFLKIINMSISASWLVLAVLLLRLVLKKAPKWVNVLLWGIVAIRLICPLTIESPISMIPDSVGSGELVSEWMDDYIDDIDIHHPDSVYYDAAIGAGREPISDGEGGYYVVTKHDQLGEPATIENTVMPVLSAVWIVGMAVLALYTVISYLRLGHRLDTAVRYKDNIYQSEKVSSPFVFGIITPRIYLPFNMDAQDLEHVVAHERAHIRRKDHWWKPLGFLLLTIHWFNPLMWIVYVLLCRDIELACDEKVIKDLGNEQRADYTQALVACSVNRRMIAACPLAFGEVGVKERVKSVMNYKKPAFWIIVLAVIACVVVAVCFLTNPKMPSVYDIYSLDGYDVLKQEEVNLRLTIPKSQLPEAIYTPEGHEFEKNEVVAYSTEATTIYLHKAMLSNESDDLLYFIFDFSYDFSNYGSFVSPFRYVEDEVDGAMSNLYLQSKDLKDNKTTYPDALAIRGHGPGTQFAFYVSKDACRAAEGSIKIDVVCNKLIYCRTGYEVEASYLLSNSRSSVKKWFDYLEVPDEMQGDGRLEINLPEFPDVTFRWYPEKIEAVTEEEIVPLFHGMPIWNTYFCDLTGDGIPDLCSTYTFGSGIIDSRIIIYDYANGASYELSDRGNFDFVLRFNEADGYLYVDKTKYNTDELVESGRLVFKDDCLQVEGFSSNTDKSTETWDLIPMVMVNGTLYLDTGHESKMDARCGVMDGEITSQVDGSKQPTIDDQSNFGTGYGYQYGATEGTIELFMNGKWWIFATEEARQEI